MEITFFCMSKIPRIVILSDGIQGGAASLANMLANDLATSDANYQILRWHFSPYSRAGTFHDHVQETSLAPQLQRPAFERLIKNLYRNLADRLRARRNERALLHAVSHFSPDLVHLHNIHSADLSHKTLLRLPKSMPLVWTLHDLWPVKAHATSWWDFRTHKRERHLIGPSSRKNLISQRNDFFSSGRNITMVSPSQYVANIVRPYALRYQFKTATIPHVVREEFFVEHDRLLARNKWQLTPGKLWIGIGSTWNNNRKGMDVFWDALRYVDISKLGLLIWGQQPQVPASLGLDIRCVGSISSALEMASLFAAVDLFVCPTKGDTGPLTVLESMAVGTPVLGCRVGGIPERIFHGLNGLLFESQNERNLADMVNQASNGLWHLEKMGLAARASVIKKHASQMQSAQYSELYRNVVAI